MYNKDKHNYEVDDRHVVEFELACTNNDLFHLLWISNQEHYIYNYVIGKLKHNYEQLLHVRRYFRLKCAYAKVCEKQSKINKIEDEQKYNDYEIDKQNIGLKLNNLYKKYHLTKHDVKQYVNEYSVKNSIHSVFVLTTIEKLYSSLDSVLYGNGNSFKFKSVKNDTPSIMAKQINRGLIVKVDKEDKFKIIIGSPKNSKKEKIELTIKPFEKHDFFLMEESEKIKNYLKNSKVLDITYQDLYEKTGIQQETFRPCFVKIVFKTIRHKTRAFVQFTIVGKPVNKKNRQGQQRHHFKSGTIGMDVGPQTVAAVGKDFVKNQNLGERNQKSSRDTEYINKELSRKMSRSRRYTNLNNYNKDGTIRKNTKTFKKKWYQSNRYKKLKYKYHEKCRKDALTRKYANQEIVNELRCHSDCIITEINNIESLKRRSKKTERQEKEVEIQQKDGTVKKVKKYKKKKRFGKSIQNRAPGMFISDCKKKFKYFKTVDKMFRASQYDHTDGQYKKKNLSERQFELSDGTIVQRDLYSAFLMYCSNLNLTEPDNKYCQLYFDDFYKMYLEFDEYVTKNNIKILNYK